MRPLLAAAAAVIAAAALSPLVLRVVRERVVDVPNVRSSHDVPTPRGGGLVIFAGVGAGLVVLGDWGAPVTGALLAAALLGAIGVAEDLRGIPVWPRLALQVVATAVALPLLLDDWSGAGWWLAVFVAGCFLWIVGFTNAFNFMDGINGIAGAQIVVAGAAFATAGAIGDELLLRNLGLVTAAAAIGFLPWNFPRARFFMGDVGSYFAGGWLAGVAVVGLRLGVSPVAVVAPLVIFGGDTALTLLGRVLRGEVWYEPHRSHVYQRLVGAGWSHTTTTLYYAALATAAAGAGLVALVSGWIWGVVATAGVLGVLATYVSSPARVGGARKP